MYSAVALSLAALAVAAPLAPSVPSVPSTDYSSSSSSNYGSSSSSSKGGKGGYPNGVQYTAQFDDVEVGLLGTITGTDIAQYDGLGYEGFIVAELGLVGNTVAGIQPESPPNVLAYGGLVGTLAGVTGGLGGILRRQEENVPLITTQYPGSAGNVFDFKSFYFGCETGVALAGVPQACTVTVTGFRNAKEVAEQEFDFKTQGIVEITEDMQKARLNRDFEGVDTVRFDTQGNGLLAAGILVTTFLDDLSYTVYNAKDAEKWNQQQAGQYGQSGSYGQEGAKKNGTSSGW